MILAALPLACCSMSVVKILQGGRGGDTLALAAKGNRLVPTADLSGEETEFVISKVDGAEDSVIEISPVMAPRKKLVAESDGAVRVVSAGKRQRPWTVKKVGDMHKLAIGDTCLALRGKTAKMEKCRRSSPAQAFMITSEDEDSRECFESSDCEQGRQRRRVRRHVHRRLVAAPSEDVEYVRVAESEIETVTDVVVKTNYETVTLHTTSIVTCTVGAANAKDRSARTEGGAAAGRQSLKFPRSVIVHVREDSGDEVPLDAGRAKSRGEGADLVQNIVRTKRKREAVSDSSTENGLEDLIKVFNGKKKHSGFIEIRAPRIFAGRPDMACPRK